MKNLIRSIVFGSLLVGSLSAQQTIKFSNYLFNKTILNPAAAGSNEYFEVIGSYRTQWASIEGAPTTAFLTADGVFFDKRIGASVQLVDDRLGALKQTGIVGNIAPRIRTSSDGWLSLGLAVGLFSSNLDGSELTAPDEGDLAIPESSTRLNLMDFKAGVYYKDYRNFGGISVFNIFQPKLNYTASDRANEGVLARHFYTFVGRVFTVAPKFNVVPSVLLKSDKNFNTELDLNAKLVYDNMIAVGLAFRNGSSVGVLAEYIHNDLFRIGYAYDYTTTDFNNYENGAHEIMLSYRFIQNKKILENPRYFYH